MADVAVVATLGLLVVFVSVFTPALFPYPSGDSYSLAPNSPASMSPESGVKHTTVVLVAVVDWLDFVRFEWERAAWVDKERTGGLNSASMMASVSLTVLSRVPAGLRLLAVFECGAESRLEEDVEETVVADAKELSREGRERTTVVFVEWLPPVTDRGWGSFRPMRMWSCRSTGLDDC